jgi:hypothetical protein
MLHDDNLLQAIAKATKTDTFATEVIKSIHGSSTAAHRSVLHQFTIQDGLLYRNQLLYVLEGLCRTQVLRSCHDSPR